MAYNKVIYGDKTIIDLTGDTVTAEALLAGCTAHGKDGVPLEGACTFDADTSDATATAENLLAGKSAYANGQKIEGTIKTWGNQLHVLSERSEAYTIPEGNHLGGGSVAINATEQGKLIAENIRSGVNILGVLGTYTGTAVTSQSKTATPTLAAQTVAPDAGYDYLDSVTVEAIPCKREGNEAGGITVTIGG